MRNVSFCLLSAVVGLGFAGLARADTVILKNGNEIAGKVTDQRESGGRVIVEIASVGRVFLKADEVARIVPEGEAAAAPADVAVAAEGTASPGDLVEVRLTEDDARITNLGTGRYLGILSPKSTADTIVLTVPGAGEIKIRNARGATIQKTDARIAGLNPPPKAPDAPAETSIKTTHVIHLANGRKLAGTVVETPASEPVKLQIGDKGYVLVPRDEIAPEGIEAVEGTIELPAPPPEPTEAAPAPTGEAPAADRDALKEEIRREVLRELLDRMIDERLRAAIDAEIAPGAGLARADAKLPVEMVQWIEQNLYDLARWRNQYRVRAERRLRELGSIVLPYLERVANHPFWLTRRAVQRIVRDIGDVRGAPIAIRMLNDADYHVRALAGEAARKLLPSEIAFNPSGSERARLAAMDRYRGLWEETLREQLRDAVLARLE